MVLSELQVVSSDFGERREREAAKHTRARAVLGEHARRGELPSLGLSSVSHVRVCFARFFASSIIRYHSQSRFFHVGTDFSLFC